MLSRADRRNRRKPGTADVDRAAAGEPSVPERLSFSAAIPAGRHGALCRIDLQLLREPQKDGERLRLRAHLQTNLASVLRPALSAAGRDAMAAQTPAGARALTSSASVTGLALRDRAARVAGAGLQQVLRLPMVRRLTAPLLEHDLNTWMEIQASTEPLDAGALAIVPQQEKLAALGIRPSAPKKGPQIENWASRTANGFVQLSLLQLNKADLPPELRERFGDAPFQIAAAVVNTVDRK